MDNKKRKILLICLIILLLGIIILLIYGICHRISFMTISSLGIGGSSAIVLICVLLINKGK